MQPFFLLAQATTQTLAWWQSPFATLIAGGLIGLLTNYFTNSSLKDREEKKLNHDAQQKELERKLELKVSQYLSAVAAISKLQVKVARIADATMEEILQWTANEGLQDAFAGLALVSPLDVLTASSNCALYWSKQFMSIMFDRLQIQTLEDYSKEDGLSVDLVIELGLKMTNLKRDLRKKCMAVSFGMQEHSIPLVKEMRKDLEMGIDGKAYEGLVRANIKSLGDSFDKYLETLASAFLDWRKI